MKTKTITASILVSALLTTSALAGGFSRGSANLDGLYASEYGDQPIISSLGVTFVNPGRSYDSVEVLVPNGGGATVEQPGYEFSESFYVPFASIGLRFSDRSHCVGSYSQPYGADSENEGFSRFYIASQEIETFELGATCSLGFDVGRGRAYAIGGLFYESLRYQQARDFNAFPAAGAALGAPDALATIDVDSNDVGFRLGAAYEISAIALKASLLYRSETEHDVEGEFNNVPFRGIFASQTEAPVLGGQAQALADQAQQLGAQAQALGAQAAQAAANGDPTLAGQLAAQAAQLGDQAVALGGQAQQLAIQANAILAGLPVTDPTVTSGRAFGTATLPQQLELNVQSGVAAGTLVFGSVKWTDWSVVQRIDLFDEFSPAGAPAFTGFDGFFRDGYTVTLGVGRAFTEELAGSLAVTYDRGVGTGFDTFSDTYTLAGGVAYDLNEIANVRAGGALIYFTEGEQTQGDTRATSPDEFGYALSTSLKLTF